MSQNSLLRKFAASTLTATVLSSQTLMADAYDAGTFSFKPVNVNLSSLTFGRRSEDSILTVPGFNLVDRQFYTFAGKHDAYRAPISFGFHGAGRNAYGYGAEFAYVLGWDTEIFGRANFSHERGVAQFLIGDRSFVFKPRTNWGMIFGARRYIDCQSRWQPYLSAAGGFTVQDKAEATLYRHNPFRGPRFETDTRMGRYKLFNRKTLLDLEFGGGVDYVFNENWAMTFDVSLRYSGRGGSRTTMTPGAPNVGYPSPPMPVTYTDNRPKWTIPVMLSLKTTGGLSSLMSAAKKIPGIENSPIGQAFTGEITNDFKYTHYRESGPRYKIDIWQNMLVVPVDDYKFTLEVQRDAQSGGSAYVTRTRWIRDRSFPANELQVSRTGATIVDDRTQVSLNSQYIMKDSSYDMTLYYSSENDFISKGLSLKGTWNFNKNNTVLTAAAGITPQTVKPTLGGYFAGSQLLLGRKSGHNILQKYYVALKQDLSKYNYVQVSTEFEYAHGYLTEPYKFVAMYGDARAFAVPPNFVFFIPPNAIYPDGVTQLRQNFPRSRSVWTPMIRFVQYVPWTDGAAHFDYRFGADTWGIISHMFEMTYYQPFMERWEVVPLIRYYSQSAAKFYGPTFNVTNNPSPFPAKQLRRRAFAGDYRLSRFGSMSYEIKLSYKAFDQMKFGFTAGYYLRRAGYSMSKKDPIPNLEINGSGVGAKYFGVDMNFKF